MAQDMFAERFEKHESLPLLRQITERAAKLASTDTTLDDAASQRLARLLRGLRYSVGLIELADAPLVAVSSLNNLKPPLDAIQQSLGQVEQKNYGALKSANQLLEDQLLPAIEKFPRKVLVDHAEMLAAVRSALEAERDSVLEEVRLRGNTLLSSLQDDVHGSLTSLRTEADSLMGQVQEEAESFRSQATAGLAEVNRLEASVEQLTRLISEQSGRVDAALTAFTTSSASLEQQRESRYSEWESKQTDKIEKVTEAEVQNLKSEMTNAIATANGVLGELTTLQQRATTLLNVIGNIGATGNYKVSADANEKVANSLRLGAIALLLVMVGLVVYIAFNVIQDQVTWQTAAFRLVSALILGIPAGYLARESGSHRAVAERMRRMELELASVDAFNALLPETERNALKAELARKYFGNTAVVSADDGRSLMTAKELVREFSSILRAFAKRSKSAE
jgi:hypothetical protein